MPEASKKAGAVWKSLSDTEKFPYERRAAIAKEEHALLYPNYRYKPTRKAKTAQKNQWEDMAQKLYAQALKEGGLDALVQSMTSIISGSHPSHNFPVSSELDMVPDVYMPNVRWLLPTLHPILLTSNLSANRKSPIHSWVHNVFIRSYVGDRGLAFTSTLSPEQRRPALVYLRARYTPISGYIPWDSHLLPHSLLPRVFQLSRPGLLANIQLWSQ